MLIKVSPTEPTKIRDLGETSITPEQFGSDVMILDRGQLIGIQRKEMSDLVASLRDGRLAKEIGQMEQLHIKVLIIEGRPVWTRDGDSLLVRGWSRKQQIGLHFSLFSRGYWLLQTDSLNDTVQLILQFVSWLSKPNHETLTNRPSPSPETKWGVRGSRSWGIHLLQGFPTIGPIAAGNIYDYFGGVPLRWTVTEDDLVQVEGVGPKRAKALIEGLEPLPAEE